MPKYTPIITALLAALLLGCVFSPYASAQGAEPVMLRYKFTPGQILRYKITLDPLFQNPAGTLQLTDADTLPRTPIVRVLTAEVEMVQADGTATVKVSVAPGSDEGQENAVANAEACTLVVSPLGQVFSNTSPIAGLSQAFFRLPFAPVAEGAQWAGNAYRGPIAPRSEAALTLTQFHGEGDGALAIINQTTMPLVTQEQTQTHDGTLLDTMRRIQSDRIVFDIGAGNVWKQTSTLNVSLALKMINRGWKVRGDFGHVIPITSITLYATVQRLDAPLPQANAGGLP